MQFFLRTEDLVLLKAYLDEAVAFSVSLEQMGQESAVVLSGIAAGGSSEWFEWYTYADWASVDHCLYIAVIEDCPTLHNGFLELHSACLDLELAGKPGRGLHFDRKAFLERLRRYRAAPGWFCEEGQPRLLHPHDVVTIGDDRSDFLARFDIEHF
ncbi:hypothetical protein ACMSIO_20405 [Pseudomonas benzopyrenica]|uniref:hypothetical protein n=1 Tax=Pseudomonas benzopyrenica TaxID=2993566 RepID=UPI0039C1C305